MPRVVPILWERQSWLSKASLQRRCSEYLPQPPWQQLQRASVLMYVLFTEFPHVLRTPLRSIIVHWEVHLNNIYN